MLDSDLAEAVRRAESRAAVIQSLKLSYGNKSKFSTTTAAVNKSTEYDIKTTLKEKILSSKSNDSNPVANNSSLNVVPLGGSSSFHGKSSSSSSKPESSGYGNVKSTARAAALIVKVLLFMYAYMRACLLLALLYYFHLIILKSICHHALPNIRLQQSMSAWRPKGYDLTRDQTWLTDSIHNKSVILDSKAEATACSITRRSAMYVR